MQCTLPFFGVHDGVDPLGVEGRGDGLGGVVVGLRLLFAPQLPGVDQRADAKVVPQQGLGLGAVEPPIRTEVPAALGQFRGLGEGLCDQGTQLHLLGGRGRGQGHGHRDLVMGVGDQVQPVADTQDLILVQGLPVRPSTPRVSCLPQSASGSELCPLARSTCPVL